MAPLKINEFLKDEDEKLIATKCQKMMYFWPKRLKKNSRKDYRKKITLAYRILKHNPAEPLDLNGLEEKLNEAFKSLGSNKPKYLKDIFHKLLAFEKFKLNEPTDEFPEESGDEEECKTKKDKAWKELKTSILRQAYKQFTNQYKDTDEDLELPPKVEEDKSENENIDEDNL